MTGRRCFLMLDHIVNHLLISIKCIENLKVREKEDLYENKNFLTPGRVYYTCIRSFYP